MHIIHIPPPPAANPPSAVSASQGMTSGPVLISWSPPVAGGTEVTGYRIYYTSGGMLMNVLVAAVLQHELDLDGALPDDMMVSVRAESAQLPSEVVDATVTTTTASTTTEPPTTTETATSTEAPMTTGAPTTTGETTAIPTTTEASVTTTQTSTVEATTVTTTKVTTETLPPSQCIDEI